MGTEQQESDPRPGDAVGPARRWGWFSIGWGFVAIGLLGVALPVLPTTPFLLLAAWAFSRSSPRFHDWLVSHRILGPPVRRWRRERVIPLHIKLVAMASMMGSLGYVAFALRPPWYLLAATAALTAAAAVFLARVPSRPSGASVRRDARG